MREYVFWVMKKRRDIDNQPKFKSKENGRAVHITAGVTAMTGDELSTRMPSILDKTFKGEL